MVLVVLVVLVLNLKLVEELSPMASPPRQIHLLAFLLQTGGHAAGWRHPDAQPGRLHDLAFYKGLAKTAERGLFDALFIADAQGFRALEGRGAFSRADLIKLEPLTLLSALAACTDRIGLIGTASTSYNEPYGLARRFASLDHISGGRSGWNIVTSTTQNEAHNFGRAEHMDHALRYARAQEFVAVVRRLWDSWEEDAIVADKATGFHQDPAKVHGLDHRGEHFSVAGPLNVARPPQGHPVLVQAGASDIGRAFAAATAEVVFTSHPTLATAQVFYAEMKALAAEAGRDPDGLLIMPAIQPVVGATQAEAKALCRQLDALIDPQTAVQLLQMQLGGFDLSPYPLDGPLPEVPAPNTSHATHARVVDLAARERLSIRQLAQRIAGARTSRVVAGTAEQVADEMTQWFDGGAADGFVISPAYLPGGLDAFVDQVVPVLQARGLFRTAYAGATLRDHLGLARPPNSFHTSPGPEPEIW